MRALQILNSPDPGGVLSLSQSIADGVASHGIDIETIFLTPRASMSAWAKLKGALSAARHIIRGNYEAVIAYQAWPSIVVGLAGLIARRPRLIVHQTTIPSATAVPVRLLDRLIGSLGLYPVNVVNTDFTRNEFANYPPAYRMRLKLIEHGVPYPVVTRTRQETLERYGIPDDLKILLNTGRLVEQKNQDTIIRALPALPNARFVVAGDGHLRSSYLHLARALGVEDRVHLLGSLPYLDVVELYGVADLFVFPSRHETFGISAVEAALLGIPTLVSDIAVLREVLCVEGKSPIAFIDETDVPAWEAALKSWLVNPPARSHLVEFGTSLSAKYSEPRMIAAYLELLRAPRG